MNFTSEKQILKCNNEKIKTQMGNKQYKENKA